MLLTIISLIFTFAIVCGSGAIVRFIIMKRTCKSNKTACAISFAISFAFYIMIGLLVVVLGGDTSGVRLGIPDLIAACINYSMFSPKSDKRKSTEYDDGIGPGVEVIQKSGKRVVYVKSTNKNNDHD